jgi:rod shape determining protein RodA
MRLPKRINWLVLVLPVLLFTLGFVTLFSTDSGLAKQHLLFFVIAAVIYLGVSLIDFRNFSYFWEPLYLLTVGLLLLTYFVGNEIFGSARWLQLGIINIQPSEFAKVMVILLVGSLLSKKPESLTSPKYLLKMLLLVLPLFILVLIQPDLGTAIVILAIVASLLWFGGLKKLYFLVGFLLLGVFSSPVWSFLRSYQKERILVFINPALDLLGAGYNVIQSTIAIGSGGLFGRGFGRGTQSHLQFLPVFWTDFIFAAFAEEWGFLGVFILLLLYSTLLIAIISVGMKSKDSFGSLICIGAFTVLFTQFLVNVGMNLGVMPVTGIPLPLVSYGGSSLLTTAVLLGLVQSVYIHEKT